MSNIKHDKQYWEQYLNCTDSWVPEHDAQGVTSELTSEPERSASNLPTAQNADERYPVNVEWQPNSSFKEHCIMYSSLQMLWNSYYYIMNSRKECEEDTLKLIRYAIERELIRIQWSAANSY